MPVKVSVTKIRKKIMAGVQLTSDENTLSSSLFLCRIFHQVFARLLKKESPFFINKIPKTSKQEWEKAVLDHLYKHLVGPVLSKNKNILNDKSRQVIYFWQAVKNMNEWITDLLWTSEKDKIDIFITPEKPLEHKIYKDGWSDSVILTGIADLVIGIQKTSDWCIVELKTGKGCREADLAQAALYHYILSSKTKKKNGVVSFIRFGPDKKELLFQSSKLIKTQVKIISLIGEIANVTNSKKKEPIIKKDKPLLLNQAKQLIEIFKEYGKEISLDGMPISGPSFIRYPIKPGKGVKLQQIKLTVVEIQHRLSLDSAPFVSIDKGKVVIDIKRKNRKTLYFSEILAGLSKKDKILGSSKILVGIDLDHNLHFADLSAPDNVHLLVAGTTGSGKSEWLRTAIASLVYTNSPDTLRFVLIDPKRTAFKYLKESKFLLNENALVYPDENPAQNILGYLANEMDNRYKIFSYTNSDSRDEYVKKTGEIMPRIVCVCDEYFDLIERNKKEKKAIEQHINRLGAKARASGIHLVIATRQPSRSIIKGTLDVNMPAKIALKMSKSIESNMVLGEKGAENLLGSGDMLFKDIGDPIRLQSPYLKPEERNLYI